MSRTEPVAGLGSLPEGGATLLTQGAAGSHRKRGRAGRVRHQEGRARFGRPGPRARHVVRGPLPHLPRQHGRQRRAGQRPERPARRRHLAAVGGQRLCADVRQLHAGRRDARRHPRAQAHHARRRGHLLRRLRRGRAGGQRRLAHRRPGHHGHRRRGQRARHPVDHPARVPGSEDPRRRARASGPPCRALRWPWDPSSVASSSASRAGGPSSGSTWDLVSSRSSWRPSPSPRRPTARGAGSTSWASCSAPRSWPACRSP